MFPWSSVKHFSKGQFNHTFLRCGFGGSGRGISFTYNFRDSSEGYFLEGGKKRIELRVGGSGKFGTRGLFSVRVLRRRGEGGSDGRVPKGAQGVGLWWDVVD